MAACSDPAPRDDRPSRRRYGCRPPTAPPDHRSRRRSAALSRGRRRGPNSRKPPSPRVNTRIQDWLSQWFRNLGAKFGEFKYASRMPAFESLLMTAARRLLDLDSALHHGATDRAGVDEWSRAGRRNRRAKDFPPARILRRGNPPRRSAPGTGTRRGSRPGGNFFPAWSIATWSMRTAPAPTANTWPNCADSPCPRPRSALLNGMVDAYDRFIYGRRPIGEPDWNLFHQQIDEAALLLHLEEKQDRARRTGARHEKPQRRLHPRAAGRAGRRGPARLHQSLAAARAARHLAALELQSRRARATWLSTRRCRICNWPVERWREPLSRLSEYGTGNVADHHPLAAGSRRSAFPSQEIDLLDDWVKKGNTLVLLGALADWDDTRDVSGANRFQRARQDHGLGHRAFSSRSSAKPADIAIEPTRRRRHRTGTLDPAALRAAARLATPPDAKMLWQDHDEPYLVDVPHGAGHVICGASDRLLSNAYLARATISPSCFNCCAGRTSRRAIFSSRRAITASPPIYAMVRLLDHPGVRFAGHAGAARARSRFLASSLVRFGPVIPLHRETGRSTLEFVDSIADLYLRADLRNDTIKYLFRRNAPARAAPAQPAADRARTS